MALPGIKQFDMSGRVAIVTGGSKGLGKAMAAGLASAGADVLLVSRNQEEADAAAVEIAADHGGRAIGLKADVTCGDDVSAVIERCLSEFGKIDVLINNAGINIRGPIDELSFEDFQQVMDVNVNGVWRMAQAVVPHMKKAGYGRIVNLASTLGLVGLSNRTPYTSSKGAVAQMTRALGLELAEFGITCNAICPGWVRTPLVEAQIEARANQAGRDVAEEARLLVAEKQPSERFVTPEEIAEMVLFLASNKAGSITGSHFVMDGGWTAQ